MRVLAFTVLLLLSATSFAQNVYRWVDASGAVHYGAYPPVGGGASALRVDGTSLLGFEGLRAGEKELIDESLQREQARARVERQRARALLTSSTMRRQDRIRACGLARGDLDRIETRLRTGYSASEFDALHTELRRARSARRHNCR